MNVWMHKETGELAIARRVWLECEVPINTEYTIQLSAASAGWAFENVHGVCFIAPPSIQESFEDLGEL